MRLLFLLSLVSFAFSKEWAVILAGSKTYGNYRHQADACHAYHVCSKFGIPDSQIITMMYDDIAHSSSNPFPGKLFNKPTAQGTAGVDVYAGTKKDYTGAKVTVDNFINVLTGDCSNGPCLKSGAEDNVFINFVDHGGTGIIAFPNGRMTSAQLIKALHTMHDKKMYKKLVFYMEACESGSMFEGLDIPPNVYVTTASNAKESSWGTYCPPDDEVDGTHLKSCLGDLYSVNWMENADSVGNKETLQAQFLEVQKATAKSHVMQYGDKSWTSEPIGNYMGNKDNSTVSEEESRQSVNVDSRDIPLHLAYYNYLRADKMDYNKRQQLAITLHEEINHRMEADLIFYRLAAELADEKNFHEHVGSIANCGECCDNVHKYVDEHCGGYSDYSLQYTRVVVNMCNLVSEDKITAVLANLC